MIEKGQKRLDSVAYPASRFCVGPQTSAAQIEKSHGDVSFTVAPETKHLTDNLSMSQVIAKLKSCAGRE